MFSNAKHTLKSTQGSIVNIVGIGGRTGSAEFAIGGWVNAAVLNLTKALADRGVTDGIRINTTNPGSITTDRLQSRIRRRAEEKGIDETAASTELATEQKITCFGHPTEIASMVAFLASPHAAYCQGTVLDIDGGQTRSL